MNKKHKVLIFAPLYLPSVRGGGPIKSIKNIVENLGDRYDFYVITTDRDLASDNPYVGIEPNVWSKQDSMMIMYTSPDWYNFKNIKKIMQENKFHSIYINTFFAYKFSILPLVIAKFITKTKIIMAPRGELDNGAVEIKKYVKKPYLALTKIIGLYKDVQWHATSEQEKTNIENIFGEEVYVHVASNLTDKHDDLEIKDLARNPKQAGNLKIVFLSRLSRKKNLIFALKTLQNLKGKVVFDIYGPLEDESYWNECQSEIKKLSKNIQINYKGGISSSEVPQTIKNYELFYLPTFGENYGHAIIEAFLSSCPVLISDQTPWRNLEEQSCGWDISLSDFEKYHQTLQQVIDMNNEEYQKLVQGSYQYGVDKLSSQADIINHSKLFE